MIEGERKPRPRERVSGRTILVLLLLRSFQGTAEASGCESINAVVDRLEKLNARALDSDLGKSRLSAQGMRSSLETKTASGSSQVFLGGSAGLRTDALLESKPWRLGGSVESYPGLPSHFRMFLGRDLLDDTHVKMSRIDSLQSLRDRLSKLRIAESLTAHLKEILLLRVQYTRYMGEVQVRQSIRAGIEKFLKEMKEVHIGGLLAGSFSRDLSLTLHENQAREEMALKRSLLVENTVEAVYGLGARDFEAIDLDWLEAHLMGQAIPMSYREEMDSLSLDEGKMVQDYDRANKRQLFLGPAVSLQSGQLLDWRRFGVNLAVAFEFGRQSQRPVLPPAQVRSIRWDEWRASQATDNLTGLRAEIDSAIQETMKIAAIEPVGGYARLNELIQKKISIAVSDGELQENRRYFLIRVLERVSQLYQGGCP